MKTFREFIGESVRRDSTALASSGTKIHPDKPHKNEFHAGWGDYEGTYILAKKKKAMWDDGPDKHIVVYGGGHHDHYPKVGETISAHNSQTMGRLGDFEVVHKTSHKDIGSMPIKKAHPLWVYK